MKIDYAFATTLGLCLAVAARVPGAFVDGDIELIRLLGEAQRSNLERIQTCSGSVEYVHRMQHGVFRPDAPNAYEHSTKIFFVEDRVRNAARSNSTDKTLFNRDSEKEIAEERASGTITSTRAPQPKINNSMRKEDGYYRFIGSVNEPRVHQIAIFPRDKAGKDWRFDGVFSLADFMHKVSYGRGTRDLLGFYNYLKDGKDEERNKTAEAKGMHAQVTRDGHYVIFSIKSEGSNKSSQMIKYDLSVAGYIHDPA